MVRIRRQTPEIVLIQLQAARGVYQIEDALTDLVVKKDGRSSWNMPLVTGIVSRVELDPSVRTVVIFAHELFLDFDQLSSADVWRGDLRVFGGSVHAREFGAAGTVANSKTYIIVTTEFWDAASIANPYDFISDPENPCGARRSVMRVREDVLALACGMALTG